MMDFSIEVIRVIVTAVIVIFLFFYKNDEKLKRISGWTFFITGFAFVLFGMIVDVTDQFPSLSKFVIIGRTPYQYITEKLVGYLLGFILIAVGLFKWIPQMLAYQEQQEQELADAEKEIKTLSSFLPICANCKKIRDDEGYWQSVEGYISSHTSTKFSHGICESCAQELYPELDLSKMEDDKKEFLKAINPVVNFVEERCELGEDKSIRKEDLYEEYKAYCHNAGLNSLSNIRFYRQLRTDFLTIKEIRPDGRNRHFKGIDLIKYY